MLCVVVAAKCYQQLFSSLQPLNNNNSSNNNNPILLFHAFIIFQSLTDNFHLLLQNVIRSLIAFFSFIREWWQFWLNVQCTRIFFQFLSFICFITLTHKFTLFLCKFSRNFAEVILNALYDAFHYFSYPTNTFAKMLDRVFPFHFLWIEFFCDLSCILYSIV